MKRRTLLSFTIALAGLASASESDLARAQQYGPAPTVAPGSYPDSGALQTEQQPDQAAPASSQPAAQAPQSSQSPPQPLGYGSPRPVEKTRPPDS